MIPKHHLLTALLASSFVSPSYAEATVSAAELTSLKNQIQALQDRLNMLEAQSNAATSQTAINAEAITATQQKIEVVPYDDSKDGITVGGAIRTNYSYNSYDKDNKSRDGDFDFDIFRLNLRGEIGDVTLNGEIRFFDYMTAIKYAFVGYQINDNWQTELGITKVPFGNSPYNSQNYFFSANYYLGLEDDYDLGIVFKRTIADNWQLDLGFFKNDELGGVDGYVDNRSDRYSYDIVGSRTLNDGIYDEPSQQLGEYNTFTGRFAYHFNQGDLATEVGVSGLKGGIHDGSDRAGSYTAWAIHTNSQYHNWHMQLQYSQYEYDIAQVDRIAVGAYSFYDSIAAEATSATVNLAYDWAVNFGPVTAIQFYNNYGIVFDKSDDTANTVMNVTGMSIAAGGLFTYFDWVHAKNQAFVGGSGSGDSNEYEQRFNINIGYYF